MTDVAGVVVIGAGPGIGQAVAKRFARAGLPVALIARRESTVLAVARTLAPFGVPTRTVTADSADEVGMRTGLDEAAAELGPPDVLVYNAAVIQPDAIGALSAQAHLDAFAVNVVGAHTAAAHVIPGMAARGGGTFLVTGGMPEPVAGYVSLSVGKAAVRALVALVDREFGDRGVHAATVTVAGPVAPGTRFDPDDIAEHYWRLHVQPRPEWVHEVVHG